MRTSCSQKPVCRLSHDLQQATSACQDELIHTVFLALLFQIQRSTAFDTTYVPLGSDSYGVDADQGYLTRIVRVCQRTP